MNYELKIRIDELPKTRNTLSAKHWRVRHNESTKWHRLVFNHTHGLKPPAPLDKCILTLERHSSAEPDYDGLVSSFKYPIDALVMAEIITDDKPSVIVDSNYRWFKTSPKKGFIIISVASYNQNT